MSVETPCKFNVNVSPIYGTCDPDSEVTATVYPWLVEVQKQGRAGSAHRWRCGHAGQILRVQNNRRDMVVRFRHPITLSTERAGICKGLYR